MRALDAIAPAGAINSSANDMSQWLRFLLARYPELMGDVLGIVYRALSTHLIKKAGYTKATAQTGSVILIQRFGSALNLNVHCHLLFLDGVYAEDQSRAVNGCLVFSVQSSGVQGGH